MIIQLDSSARALDLSPQDLQHLLSRGNNKSEEEIMKLVDQMEPDREGLINYAKYVETVLA